MAEWGRKEYAKKWPSRMPVWTLGAVLLTPVLLAGLLTWQYERSWTAAERLYLTDYLKSGARGEASATAASKYTLLEAVVGQGRSQGQPGDRRRDRAGSRVEWEAGLEADGRGREERHRAVAVGDGRVAHI